MVQGHEGAKPGLEASQRPAAKPATREPPRQTPWTEQDQSAVRDHLDRLLASAEFAQAERLRRFLRLIVNAALDGTADQLKGYTIGVEVFDRPASFDPTIEPIVRVEAGRLRAKLREYYHGTGRQEAIRIDIPKGAYAPEIALQSAGVASVTAAAEKPSLAVLPFDNQSADPEQNYFADGITEDLITALAKVSGFLVISRHSTFAYRATNKPLAEVAQALGARYVLTGTVRRAGDQVRISAQLIDTVTGHVPWAERYDRSVSDIFAVQDEVTGSIAQALRVKLTGYEADRLGHEGTVNGEAHDWLFRGLDKFWRYTPETCAEAAASFRKAIEEDPNYAAAHAWLTRAYVFQWAMRWSEVREESLDLALRHAKRAIELDDLLPMAHAALGWAHLWDSNAEQAIAECLRACSLDPNNADAHLFASLSLSLEATPRGREGLRYIEIGMRLNPHPSSLYLYARGNCYFVTEKYEEALADFTRGIEINPYFPPNHVFRAGALALLGRIEEARAQGARALQLIPHHPPLRNMWTDPELAGRFHKCMRLAGMMD